MTKLYFLPAGVLAGQKMTTYSYTLMVMAAWLNAVFWSAMPIVGWAGYAPDPTGATCTINWRNNDAWVPLIEALSYNSTTQPFLYSQSLSELCSLPYFKSILIRNAYTFVLILFFSVLSGPLSPTRWL